MSDESVFLPDLGKGLAFHIFIVLALIGAGVFGLWQASRAAIGPQFLLYLLFALLLIGLVPFVMYRAMALRRAYYTILRDGIKIHWGLRFEIIPIDKVLWVRSNRELEQPLRYPLVRWPGAVLGKRKQPLGEIEFLAAGSGALILIATPKRIFAISPADPDGFVRAYNRVTELGSLTPLESLSVYPSFLLARVWASVPARALLLTGLVLSLLLLVWVSLAIPGRSQIFLGFDAQGNPRDLIPAVSLLLIPILNSFIYLTDLILGMFFFRREQVKHLAYLLWAAGALTPFLFLVAVFSILRAS